MSFGFGSLAFYPFLALVWAAWALARPSWRGGCQAVASLVFVLWLGQPTALAALAALFVAAWYGGRGRRAAVVAAMVLAVAVLLLVRLLVWAGPPAWAAAAGVSYFSLQAAAYLADIAMGIQEPAASPLDLWLYLAWFPKFAQGPFERFGAFTTQLRRSEGGPVAQDLREGLLLLAWGLFEKMVVAERAAELSDATFLHLSGAGGPRVWGAAYVFAVRLYADFAGYTDMARGASLLFGLRLSPNFDAPFLATSVADFWRRWHITLSDWVRDYVFVPLQMAWRNHALAGTLGAVFISYLLVGLWHGSGMGYLLMGLLQALWMGLALLSRGWRKSAWKALGQERGPWRQAWDVLLTFHLTCLTFLCFQAADMAGLQAQSGAWARGWGSGLAGQFWQGLSGGRGPEELAVFGSALGVLLAVHLAGRRGRLLEARPWLRYPAYAGLAFGLLFFGRYFASQGFLYARF